MRLNTTRLFRTRRSFPPCTLLTRRETRLSLRTYGIEHEAIDGAFDVTIFEDLGNGQTRLTHIGNEPMESARNSGQLEGWNQILDKIAEVIAGLVQAK